MKSRTVRTKRGKNTGQGRGGRGEWSDSRWRIFGGWWDPELTVVNVVIQVSRRDEGDAECRKFGARIQIYFFLDGQKRSDGSTGVEQRSVSKAQINQRYGEQRWLKECNKVTVKCKIFSRGAKK